MAAPANGARYVNAYCNETVTLVSIVEWKAIRLTTLFQDTYLVKVMPILNQIFKRCAFRAIQRKGGGFLIARRHL